MNGLRTTGRTEVTVHPREHFVDAMGKTHGNGFYAIETGDLVTAITLSDSPASRANARLYASALEMLEALETVNTLINGVRFHDEQERLQVWAKVSAAILRAKGWAP